MLFAGIHSLHPHKSDDVTFVQNEFSKKRHLCFCKFISGGAAILCQIRSARPQYESQFHVSTSGGVRTILDLASPLMLTTTHLKSRPPSQDIFSSVHQIGGRFFPKGAPLPRCYEWLPSPPKSRRGSDQRPKPSTCRKMATLSNRVLPISTSIISHNHQSDFMKRNTKWWQLQSCGQFEGQGPF